MWVMGNKYGESFIDYQFMYNHAYAVSPIVNLINEDVKIKLLSRPKSGCIYKSSMQVQFVSIKSFKAVVRPATTLC
jgi:hypothetical protein